MPFWFGKELPSRHNDDGAIDVRPQDALSDQEPLYSPLTWGPKSLSHDILIAKRLVKTFPTGDSTNSLVRALNKLSLDTDTIAEPIRANEFVIITGPGNAGKSTLLKTFGGLIPPDGGELTLHLGRDTFNLTRSSSNLQILVRMRVNLVGYVLQPPTLLCDLTALENVEFPMILAQRRRNIYRNEAISLLKAIGLADRINVPAWQLSKSEQQRVAIAQAFANSPLVVFLDDPTNNLNYAETIQVMDFLMAKNRETPPTAIVMVCDNVLLHCYADRILHMANGCLQRSDFHYIQRKLDKAKYVAHMTLAASRARAF